MIELDVSRVWVTYDLHAFRRSHQLVRVPEGAKLRAALGELPGKLIERRAIRRTSGLVAKTSHQISRVHTVVGRFSAKRWFGEHRPQRVHATAITPQGEGRSVERN